MSDQTLGQEFTFRAYSRRYLREFTYTLKRVDKGWYFRFDDSRGRCDKKGWPLLFRTLERSGIEYPSNLGERLQWLWERAATQDLTREQVQGAFDNLSDWLKDAERELPHNIVWEGVR